MVIGVDLLVLRVYCSSGDGRASALCLRFLAPKT